jgi:hypothetical protein
VRTTLDIDDDVLQAAKEIGQRERTTAGAVLSRLARAGLRLPSEVVRRDSTNTVRNGVPVFPARAGEIITLEHVQKLVDEEGI